MTIPPPPVRIKAILGLVGAVLALNVLFGILWQLPRVETEVTERAPMSLIVRAGGAVEAKQTFIARAMFDGPVIKKLYREGQVVQKGTLLLIIGRDRIRPDYQGRLDSLKNAESDLARSHREVRLQRALYNKQAVAYSSVEDAERAVVKAEQALRLAKQNLEIAQQMWNSAEVVAPFDGTVVRDAIGDDKQVSSAKEIFTLADVSEYSVRARVDELDIKQVAEGQPAEIRLQVFPDRVFFGTVTQVGSAPDSPGLLEIPVVLKLASTQGEMLRPRLTAEARIFTGKTEPVLSVAKSAISNADGRAKVWVVDPLRRLRARRIETGRSNPERTEVTKGLTRGERVCLNAEPDFADGMMVRRGKPDPKRTQSLLKEPDTPPSRPARRGPPRGPSLP